jgi:hypothetical protein
MGDTSGRMRLIAITGTVSGLAVLFWVASMLDATRAPFVPGPLSSELMIGLPLVALLFGAGIAWFVVTRKSVRPTEADPDAYVACGCCDRSILRDWRLCPYCGCRVERSDGLPEGSGSPTS